MKVLNLILILCCKYYDWAWVWQGRPGLRRPAVLFLDAIFPMYLSLGRKSRMLIDSFQRY